MTEYRRVKVEGATYSFTVNCAERRGNPIFVDNINLPRDVFRKVNTNRSFKIDALVVLPEQFALYVDAATRRCGLQNAMGIDIGRVFPRHSCQ